MSTSVLTAVPLTPVITRKVRAYFAPVDRNQGIPTIFDPAQWGGFDLDHPPAPWLDLGWLDSFERRAGTKVVPLRSGAPGLPLSQVRTEIDALIDINFSSWGKLQMAVTSGSEQMNLIVTTPEAAANGSGGPGMAAIPVLPGSTATLLNIAPNSLSQFAPGQMVTVDVDYVNQTGFVGSGISSAYIGPTATAAFDVNYIRRISFNVARIISVSATGLQLAQPLIAGTPTGGMSVQPILGFVDREGSKFFLEWSALFVVPGVQGDRVIFHYPRLQIASGASESSRLLDRDQTISKKVEVISQTAHLRALPVTDMNDGAQVICFRSYLPATATRLW